MHTCIFGDGEEKKKWAKQIPISYLLVLTLKIFMSRRLSIAVRFIEELYMPNESNIHSKRNGTEHSEM